MTRPPTSSDSSRARRSSRSRPRSRSTPTAATTRSAHRVSRRAAGRWPSSRSRTARTLEVELGYSSDIDAALPEQTETIQLEGSGGRRGDPARLRQRRLRVRLGEPGHLPRLDRLTPRGAPSAIGSGDIRREGASLKGALRSRGESRPEMSMMSTWMPADDRVLRRGIRADRMRGHARRRRPRCPGATTPSPSTPRRSRPRSTTRTGRWSRARGGRTSRPTPTAAS